MFVIGKAEVKIILIWCGIFLLSNLAIRGVYLIFLDNWRYWIQSSAILSTFTCLYARIFAVSTNKSSSNSALFTLLIMPINVLLIYPGTTNLGISSDTNFIYFLLLLEVIHGLGFYLVRVAISKNIYTQNI